MKCLGILWNVMNEYKEEAMNDIGGYAEIEESFDLNLDEEYEKFVRDIYAQDDIAEWKVDKKIETMYQCSTCRKVTIIIMDIDVQKQYYHQFKKRMVYESLEQMKVNIRKKYSNLVQCYFFDNVFHVTDNEQEYILDNQVIEKYLEKKEKNTVAKKKEKIKKDDIK